MPVSYRRAVGWKSSARGSRQKGSRARTTLSAPVVLAPVALRYAISEASALLRMSRAQLYNRIREGSIKAAKDGGRTYITRSELERYVESCR